MGVAQEGLPTSYHMRKGSQLGLIELLGKDLNMLVVENLFTLDVVNDRPIQICFFLDMETT